MQIFTLSNVKADGEGWLSGYNYRKQIPITGSSGSGTSYQVSVLVHSGIGTDSNGVIFLNGNSEDFPSILNTSYDISFTDNDGITELDSWIEEIYSYGVNTNDIVAKFWIEITDSLESGTVNFYIYYGKATGAGSSNDSGTFLTGADFDDGTTTGLTLNTGGSGALTVPNPTKVHTDINLYNATKCASNPIVALGAASSWNDHDIRDLGILLESDNTMRIDSGNIIAYMYGYDSSDAAIGRFTSADGGKTWSAYGSNPVFEKSSTADRFDEYGIQSAAVMYLSGVGPDTDKPYKMIYCGIDDENYRSFGLAESSDGLSWTRYDGANTDKSLTGLYHDDYHNGVQVINVAAVPWIIKYGNKILLVFEGAVSGSGVFRIYGALSGESDGEPDLTTWTPLNQTSSTGRPILSNGTSGQWDDYYTANPKVVHLGSDKFILAYTGNEGSSSQTGFAYTTDAPASWSTSSWTKYANNPVIYRSNSGGWDDTFLEPSAFVIDDITNGCSNIRFWYQGSDGTNFQTGLAYLPQGRLLRGLASTTSDGYIIGKDLDGITNFHFETLVDSNDRLSADVSLNSINIYDSAAVPSPTTVASWNGNRRIMVYIGNNGYTSGKVFLILYWDTGSTVHYYDGSSWDTSSHILGNLEGGLYKVCIEDNGTNYKIDIQDGITGDSLLTSVASIAKSSVKTFSNGRVIAMGDVYTDTWYNSYYYDNIILRKYITSEPIVGTASSEEVGLDISLDISNYGFGNLSNNEVANTGLSYFTVTNNGSATIDISIHGIDMTGTGVTWDLADDGNNGDGVYSLYAGLSGGSYNIIVRETQTYNVLKEDLSPSGTQSFGLQITAPTTGVGSVLMTGTITLTASLAV